MPMIERTELLAAIRKALSRSRVVILTGPRQCGKTTLARHLLSETSVNYFDLEDPVDLNRLAEPMTALGQLKGLVVIDEIQRRPDLFPILRVLAVGAIPPESSSWEAPPGNFCARRRKALPAGLSE
jgi:predicted AAA+ superfamily ATPase